MGLSRRWLLLLFVGAPLAAAASFSAGLAVTDRLEQDNRFCIACHVTEEKRLHQDKYDGFLPVDGLAASLAAAHHGDMVEPFKCVDCHNGATFSDKLMIKAQAASDTIAYFLGDFEEPRTMRFSLGNRLCQTCHSKAGDSAGKTVNFHQADHHAKLPFLCYECHQVHLQTKRETQFLERDVVQPLCDECHSEL
jgi:nitrate/TMAO reductase-like tetraheme cytochrome c subunit